MTLGHPAFSEALDPIHLESVKKWTIDMKNRSHQILNFSARPKVLTALLTKYIATGYFFYFKVETLKNCHF